MALKLLLLKKLSGGTFKIFLKIWLKVEVGKPGDLNSIPKTHIKV